MFGSAFYIFLQRQFFLGLPRELFEAARIDGASYFGLFRRIALPLSIPSLVVIFIFEFQASWNNLQSALIYLNAGSVEGFTAPLGIAYAMTKYSPTNGGQGDYQFVMVATLLITCRCLSSSPSGSGISSRALPPRAARADRPGGRALGKCLWPGPTRRI